MKSLFTGIYSSSESAVSSTQLIYSFTSFLICLFILLSLLIYIFFKSIAWNLLSRIPYSVIPFPFPDSGFHLLVLPWLNLVWLRHMFIERRYIENVTSKAIYTGFFYGKRIILWLTITTFQVSILLFSSYPRR